MHIYTKTAIELFRKNENPAIAPAMSAYLKNLFPFLGIMAPKRRELFAELNYLKIKPEEISLICKELYFQPEREFHHLACELLVKYAKKQPKEFILEYEYFITNNSWWDSVDTIVPNALAVHFKRYPELVNEFIPRWLTSGNIWLQRSCILFQLKYKKEVDTELLTHIITNLSFSTEFFVQKAIGWMLREYSKTNPGFVLDFVENNSLKPLSKREALKRIQKN